MPDDARRPLLFRVLDAVVVDGFPDDLRHLCVRYAYEANAKTGTAYYGQSEMARRIGISPRELRRRLKRLDDLGAKGESPVQIVRQRRGGPGGVGRSSDEWRIEVLKTDPKRTALSGSETRPSGQRCPVELEAEEDRIDTRRGQDRPSEEDDVVLGSSGGSSGEIQRSTSARDSACSDAAGFALEAPEPAKRKQAVRRKAKRKRTDEDCEAHRAILEAFVASVEQSTRAKPGIDARTAAAAWRLLDWSRAPGRPSALAIVRHATTRSYGRSTSLVAIAADPNKHLPQPEPTNGKARPVQQPDGYADVEALRARERELGVM